ncbi:MULTISPECIES: D-glycero-beta-D-manno-heptose 1,7-bisphosphate 7-phosphatase [unclassified Agarivorans]|uniref:D-glycero-beta-D-manno-heptose 1,7-bisphosphate 7-phosphatase n=1 Tax=unclassified Agarivorans TaxID=2636026 RepID=UPI0010E90490|nr:MULTISPECIES: D-glycero-beta-D-manno-heptose 1,7-bisphosphate 7-phosphatase [unclassified Agarivorans]MDO6687396.1 D-glycero-beta-D-manno-heptose 1,7-bisphosphate 7-phosphatase [Agarivorans sp. 3_MG-2023]MDO6717054.1 D-glycero-beta-D-manno-heptose 1,7-bisphosphate 7-phosphatase [Agarivorans sp. 2_MG-2023]MDO6765000.1 D-glycero-beta-D-manno-heptose 1,7-bisphosphate 7-phosphatase [Agarivorans sp. 1_MG-2023]GDY25711.1 D,D-heptose 1,7-bisphosphate phosphatase [Agarivorans sp. Toyoura001]
MKQPAIFLDRDGVINHDRGYVSKVDDFEFIDGAIEAMQQLKKAGWLLVVVTNQAGIARGYFSEEQFVSLTEWMDWSLADRGVDLDGIYFCPHHSKYGDETYRQDCDCRKPQPGMLLEAAAELNIDLSKSWLVGDKASDLLAAKNAGVPNRLLVEGQYPISEQEAKLAIAKVASLQDAAVYIQQQG